MNTIMRQKIIRAALGLALAAVVGSSAQAHAKLVKADPADGATAAPTNMAQLSFYEEISGKRSGAKVTDASGKDVPETAMAGG